MLHDLQCTTIKPILSFKKSFKILKNKFKIVPRMYSQFAQLKINWSVYKNLYQFFEVYSLTKTDFLSVSRAPLS